MDENLGREMQPRVKTAGWSGFLIWSLVGLFGVSVLVFLPFSVVLLPVVAFVGNAVEKRVRTWPEGIGAGLGFAALSLWVSYTHRDIPACGEMPSTGACTGVHGQRYLYAGLIIAALCIGSYVILRLQLRRSRGLHPSTS